MHLLNYQNNFTINKYSSVHKNFDRIFSEIPQKSSLLSHKKKEKIQEALLKMDQNYVNYGYSPVYAQLQSSQPQLQDPMSQPQQQFTIYPPQHTPEPEFDNRNQAVPMISPKMQFKIEKPEEQQQYIQFPTTSQNDQHFQYQHQNYLPPPPPMFQTMPMWHENDGQYAYSQVVPQYPPMGYHPHYMMPTYQHMGMMRPGSTNSPMPQLSPVSYGQIEIKEKPSNELYCNLCNKHFISPANLKRHWMTKVHTAKEVNAKISNPTSPAIPELPEQTIEVKFLEVQNQPSSTSITDLSEAEVVLIDNIDKELSSIEPSWVQSKLSVLPCPTQPLSSPEIVEEFRCDVCSKTFTKRCYFTQHNKTAHIGHKPFKCPRCGKKYQTQELLDDHLMKHDGEKPFKCELCPKSFNHKTDLKRHTILHTTEKPHICGQCGKGFVRKDHLQKHLGSHMRKMEKLKRVFTNTIPMIKQ